MNGLKMKGMLGLALRARQATLGTDACRGMIRSGKCGVLLLDETAGIHTRKRAEEECKRTGTPIRIIPQGMIEEATGKGNIMMGIQEGMFSQQILQCIPDNM